MAFDISQARSRFPALNQEHIFLDNAGGSQALDTVIELSEGSMQHPRFRPRHFEMRTRWLPSSSMRTWKRYASGHQQPNSSTTSSTALEFQAGDELILSKLNHEANTAAWVRIAQRLGLRVKCWAAADATNPVCDVEELKTLLTEKTRLMACPHVSNITGVDYGCEGGCWSCASVSEVCVDGDALAPHRPVDVEDLDVDIYAIAAHEERLQGILLEFLNSRPDRFRLIGASSASGEVRVPVVEWVAKRTQGRLGIEVL